MPKPKISIITATYNAADTLEQTIVSVINQTYSNKEYIIIDGGSTDGTIDIIKKYEDKISYWVSESDKGIYEAFNKGVRVATGDYIEFIGADDCFCDCDVISRVAEKIEDTVDILSCCQYAVEEHTGYQKEYTNFLARNRATYSGGMVPHGSMFVKKEILEKYPFDESYKIAGDYKFFLLAYYDTSIKIKYTDIFVLFFSANGASADEEVYEENHRIVQELHLPKSFVCDNRSVWRKVLRETLIRMGCFSKIKYLKDKMTLEKHHCNNRICRWCGRGL